MTTSAAFDPAKLGVPIDQWEVGLKISCSAISLSSFTLINLPLPFSVGVFSELNPSCKRGCAFSELNLSSDFLLFLSSGVHGNRHRGGTWRLATRLRSRRERGGARQGAQARHLPRDRRLNLLWSTFVRNAKPWSPSAMPDRGPFASSSFTEATPPAD